jgi:SAM-dependent methyltransferase
MGSIGGVGGGFLNATIDYYNRNAEHFSKETVHADMSELYKPFLAHIPLNGRILDAGCGSGRDSLFFIQHGYQVEAFDASSKMCDLASRLIGQSVHLKTFDEVEWRSAFDGIWACASLVHVCRASIDNVLERLCRALKSGGAMFLSFKHRDEEWEQNGRFFNGYSEDTFRRLIKGHSSVLPVSIWLSNDARPGRKDEMWLNALLQRANGNVCLLPQPENIEQRIAVLCWKYAKTYPDAPHEYILQKWDPEVFAYFEEKLRTEAVREEYTLRGRTNWYCYYYPGDGYRYWIIDYVLNRCRVADAQRSDLPDAL